MNKTDSQLRKLKGKCEEVSGLLKALSHPGRLLIMGCLCSGKRTVSELQELCDLSQSQLSQFLSRMRLEGLVRNERQGRFNYYMAADERVVKLIRVLQTLYC